MTETVEKSPMNLVQLREELAKIKKRDTELDIRGNKTDEYCQQFTSLSMKEADEIYAKISKLSIPRFKDIYIHKIIDIMPRTVGQLKVVLQGYSLTITNENLKKIVDILENYQKKKKEDKKEEKQEKKEEKKEKGKE
ncbi:MAG: hypothetical protein V1743_01055 [Nanoarchaeota archaeon]